MSPCGFATLEIHGDLLMAESALSIFVSILLAGMSVLVHYESLCFLDRVLTPFGSHRKRLLVTMFGVLAANIVEIWLYAGAYMLLERYTDLGAIMMGVSGDTTPLDTVYYSAMVYTTVGFGDMLPSGGLRIISATEALVGLSLITWSASFTFFQMQAMFGKNRE